MPDSLKADPRDAAREVRSHVKAFVRLDGSEILQLFREAASEWVDDKAPRLGAALAYYTMLSMAPLLVVAVAIAALVFGRDAVEGELFGQMTSLLGHDAAATVQSLIRNASDLGSGLFATTVGLFILLFAASSVVIELEDALNTIWHVSLPAPTGRWGGLLDLAKSRIYSFAMILGTGLLLLISLLLNTFVSLVATFFSSHLPVPAIVLRTAEFVLAFAVTTILFAAIYKFMPAVRLRWSDVFIGACVTALLFTIGKQLIGFYLGREGFTSAYGAAGSLVAVLVWVYYSAQLFFLGAEFTKVYTRRLGSFRPAGT